MSVEYINGNYYNIPGSSADGLAYYAMLNSARNGNYKPINAPATTQQPSNNNATGIFGNPFGTASSGTEKGTLQPYINRQNQMASNALYGGLLGYQPQSMIAGSAGGIPQNSQVPQWSLPSAIPTANQGQVGLLGPQANNYMNMNMQQPIFGNRSWMEA